MFTPTYLEDDKKNNDSDKAAPSFQNEVFESRTIIISEEISPKLAQSVFTQLVILNKRSETDPITVYINSPGGCADSGFAMYDMLRYFPAPVTTVCSGLCASAAVIIFLAADKGRHFSLPNSRFLLHQPSTGVQGSASDIEITADEITKTRVRYNDIVAATCGKTNEDVTKDADRDFWMSPEEAKTYGLVADVITSISAIR